MFSDKRTTIDFLHLHCKKVISLKGWNYVEESKKCLLIIQTYTFFSVFLRRFFQLFFFENFGIYDFFLSKFSNLRIILVQQFFFFLTNFSKNLPGMLYIRRVPGSEYFLQVNVLFLLHFVPV